MYEVAFAAGLLFSLSYLHACPAPHRKRSKFHFFSVAAGSDQQRLISHSHIDSFFIFISRSHFRPPPPPPPPWLRFHAMIAERRFRFGLKLLFVSLRLVFGEVLCF